MITVAPDLVGMMEDGVHEYLPAVLGLISVTYWLKRG